MEMKAAGDWAVPPASAARMSPVPTRPAGGASGAGSDDDAGSWGGRGHIQLTPFFPGLLATRP